MKKINGVMISKFEAKRDNLCIRGKIYGEATGARPAVILSHGFLANQMMCKKYAICLAKMGYICFTFDFCGGGLFNSSDGKTTEMSIFSEVKDLEAVIGYVKDCTFVDGEKISLLGCSQGGVVSAMVAKKQPEKIWKLILFYPALCIPDDARKGKMVFAKFNPVNVPEKMWCGPMRLGRCYVDTVNEINMYDYIGGYEGKVFLIHGCNDKLVDITYSQKAKNFYRDIEYYEIEGAGHGFKGKYDDEAIKLLSKFMMLRE